MNAAPPPGSPTATPAPSRRPSNVVILLGALVVLLAGLLVVSVVRDDGDSGTAPATLPGETAPVNGAGAGASATTLILDPSATGGVGGDLATIVTLAPPTVTLPPTTVPAAAPTTSISGTDTAPAEPAGAIATADVAGIGDAGAVGADLAWVLSTDGTGQVTTDSGATWTQLELPADAVSLTFADSTHGWVTTTGPGWFSTHDGGATWNDLGELGEVPSGDPIAADPATGQLFAAVGGDGGVHLLVSPIDVDDFVDVGLRLPYGAGPVFDVSMFARDGSAWVVYNNRIVSGAILVEAGTADGAWLPPAADKFGPVRIVGTAASSLLWAIADTNLWGGDSDPLARVYLSVEGGTVWQEIQGPPGVGQTAAAGAGAGDTSLYVGVGPILYASQVQRLSDPPVWTPVADLTADGVGAIVGIDSPAIDVVDVRVIVGDHEEIRRSTDGGRTWQVLARATAG